MWCPPEDPPSLKEVPIHEPGSEWTPAEPPHISPSSQLVETHAYGRGPTGPSGISFPTAMYTPTRRTAAGGGGGGG